MARCFAQPLPLSSLRSFQRGFTLLEALIVISILSILLALGVPMLRAPSAYLLANDLKAMVQQARFESIKRNTPVAFVWHSSTQLFTTRLHPSNPSISVACTGTTVLNTKRLADYRNASVQSALSQNGLVWLPTGLGALCSGGTMENSMTITDGRVSYSLLISAAGQVTLQRL